jgi:hypothetical protein
MVALTLVLCFQISGCLFLLFYDDHFPEINSEEWPPSVTDPEAFSPILDMLNGFVWQLWCDHQSTMATVLNRNYLMSFLSLGTTAVTSSMYLGTALPGRFCPNYDYHFKFNGWPIMDLTPSQTQDLLHPFEPLPLIS